MDFRLIYASPRDRVEHVLFALKHEGTRLAILHEALKLVPAEALVHALTAQRQGVRASMCWRRCKTVTVQGDPDARRDAVCCSLQDAFMAYNCVHNQTLEIGMDYVTVRELREKSGEIWQRVEAGEEFVITRNGKPFALLVHTEPTAVEDRLRALRLSRMAELARAIQGDAQASGASLLTDEDIQEEIDAARRKRRASPAAQTSTAAAQPPVAAEPAPKYRARRR
jgi:prevent-host-death family protein